MEAFDGLPQSAQGGRIRWLSSAEEQKLVSRLYDVEAERRDVKEQQLKDREAQRQREELQECTFKPQLAERRLRSQSCQRPKGFEKAINRLRVGVEKATLEKRLREYTPSGQGYEKIKLQELKPPSFLQRQRHTSSVLFVIEFDLGRHQLKVKVRERDTPQSIASSLCQIYSLKKDYYEQILDIIQRELDNYHALAENEQRQM